MPKNSSAWPHCATWDLAGGNNRRTLLARETTALLLRETMRPTPRLPSAWTGCSKWSWEGWRNWNAVGSNWRRSPTSAPTATTAANPEATSEASTGRITRLPRRPPLWLPWSSNSNNSSNNRLSNMRRHNRCFNSKRNNSNRRNSKRSSNNNNSSRLRLKRSNKRMQLPRNPPRATQKSMGPPAQLQQTPAACASRCLTKIPTTTRMTSVATRAPSSSHAGLVECRWITTSRPHTSSSLKMSSTVTTWCAHTFHAATAASNSATARIAWPRWRSATSVAATITA
mmetsp:Transcript_4753/g.13702  ORF Transcript_4753/g.13702 Transcript_4753/m.13702 type:complete len:284 (+) Transcript_4753:171-1022(+)